MICLLGDDANAGKLFGADARPGNGLGLNIGMILRGGWSGIGVGWDGELTKMGLDRGNNLVMLLLGLLLLLMGVRMSMRVLSFVFVGLGGWRALESVEEGHGLAG